MKKINSLLCICRVLFLFLESSCNDANDSAISNEDSVDATLADTTVSLFEHPDSNFVVLGVDSNLLWTINVDKKTMKRPKSKEVPVLGLVIGSLNAQYPDIQLLDPQLAHDTLMLRIPNSNYLTNQIGTTGAAQYLAQVVLNLTTLPGVSFVKLDFEMGSHASPGTWSRKDFPGYTIIQ